MYFMYVLNFNLLAFKQLNSVVLMLLSNFPIKPALNLIFSISSYRYYVKKLVVLEITSANHFGVVVRELPS